MQGNTTDDIRSKILWRTYAHCRKLLGPGGDSTEPPAQWDREFPGIAFTDTHAATYPLSLQEQTALANARTLQHVQMGSTEVINLDENGLLPALFIENAAGGYSVQEEGAAVIGTVREILPLTLRLVLRQPPNATYDESTVVQAMLYRTALDYLLDPGEFRSITTVQPGYAQPARVFDAGIINVENLEGEYSPYEVVDFRFEVTFDRPKEKRR